MSLIPASAAVTSGCVVPPPGEVVDIDAGTPPNSPPIIVGASPSPDFDFPGPLRVQRADPGLVTLTFRDNDADDTLHVRFFVDYDRDTPSHQSCGSGQVSPDPSGGVERSQEFCIATWCSQVPPGDDAFHTLEVMVSDSPFNDAEQPLYRSITAGGLRSTAVWRIQCREDL